MRWDRERREVWTRDHMWERKGKSKTVKGQGIKQTRERKQTSGCCSLSTLPSSLFCLTIRVFDCPGLNMSHLGSIKSLYFFFHDTFDCSDWVRVFLLWMILKKREWHGGVNEIVTYGWVSEICLGGGFSFEWWSSHSNGPDPSILLHKFLEEILGNFYRYFCIKLY